MKTIKTLCLFVFLFGTLYSSQSFAQLNKYVDDDFSMDVTITKRNLAGEIVFQKTYTLEGVELVKVNEVGKMLRILTFRLSDNDFMELANPFAFFSISKVTGDFDHDGNDETIDGNYAILTKSGNFKLVYHSI